MATKSSLPRSHELVAVCGSRIIRVAQLEQLGFRRSTISRRCRPGGIWQAPVPGVVVLHNGPLKRDDRRRIALAHAGSDAVITGLDALVLAGMERVPAPHGPVHVLVPDDRRRTGHATVLVERTERLPEAQPGRWPLAPETRAVLDYTGRLSDHDLVRSAISEVVQRGRSTPFALAKELDDGSCRGTALPRAVVKEVADGVRSVAEARARRLLLRSTVLPPALWNPTLYDTSGAVVATPDAWFDAVALAWEIDSREWHLGPKDYEMTVLRRSVLVGRFDVELVQTLPRTLHEDPRGVLAELERAYVRAARRPRPPLIAVPAPAA